MLSNTQLYLANIPAEFDEVLYLCTISVSSTTVLYIHRPGVAPKIFKNRSKIDTFSALPPREEGREFGRVKCHVGLTTPI